jgi:hypothetical protein
MSCRNHPQTPAAATCVGCAEPFCKNCLVQLAGQSYCGSCKVLALNGRVPTLENRLRPCKEAGDALKFAFIGLFCFGFILGPMAIGKAIGAKKLMRDDPTLLGSGKANAALIIGILALLVWVMNFASRFA